MLPFPRQSLPIILQLCYFNGKTSRSSY